MVAGQRESSRPVVVAGVTAAVTDRVIVVAVVVSGVVSERRDRD